MLFLLITTGLNTLYSLPSLHIRRSQRLLTTHRTTRHSRNCLTNSNRAFIRCNFILSWRMSHVTIDHASVARPSGVGVTEWARTLPTFKLCVTLTLHFTYKKLKSTS